MLITVRLFARLRELTGKSELTLVVPENATAQWLWKQMALEYADLADYERAISCAVNEEYAPLTTVLKDGDEVAFLPPVSGG
jgi:molybdopterin converting factor subunit 1